MDELLGRLVGNRYLINSLLAQGGMASVYLAHDRVLEREVAIKIIHPHLASDPAFLEKFRREAKVAAKLSHPNLVRVYDAGQDAGTVYLVMEYVAGITLRDVIRDFGALEPNRVLEIIEPLSQALAAAHQAGIVHRDLKPENVFLSDTGSVKLGDFGLARPISQHTESSSVIGTVAYLAPELVLRGQADARSDVYSLGVMLFELLTGRQPFLGEQAVQIAYQHANENVPRPSSIKPDVPELLDELVLWCTAKDPKNRPASASSLAPLIVRARSELSSSKPNTLVNLANTAQISFNTEVLDPQPTEVISNLNSPAEIESPVATKLQKANRRSSAILVLMTAFALIVSSGAGWWFSQGPGGLIAIPELSGRSFDQAKEALEASELMVEQDKENSSEIKAGQVIRTDPPAGSQVFRNSTVTVFVSLGPLTVAIPEVEGLSLDQVNALLIDSNLVPGQTLNYFSDLPKGQVLALDQPTSAQLEAGSTVNISVSLGPLPDVIGLASDQALAELSDLDIDLVTSEEFSSDISEGSVISLNPAEYPLREGGKAELVVSKGPEIVAMPSVVGETIAAARSLLRNLGLEVVIDTNQLSSNFGVAKVKRQSPSPSTQLRKGDTVRIISR